MKKVVIIILALTIALTLVIIAGCGGEESPAPDDSEDMQTQSEDQDMQASDEEEDMQVPEEEMEEETPSDDMEVSGYVDVTAAEAKALIDQNPDLIIIDVSPHYAEGHLPGAVNYYLGDGSLDAAIPNLDKNADYLVYCHVDSVSISGAQKLIDAGFTNVYRLEGNYSAWVGAGYPVETGT